MTPMKVLVACEFSGVVRRAFAARGHDAWSCDLLPAEDRSNKHIVGDARDILGDGWDLLIRAAIEPAEPSVSAAAKVLLESKTVRTLLAAGKKIDAEELLSALAAKENSDEAL